MANDAVNLPSPAQNEPERSTSLNSAGSIEQVATGIALVPEPIFASVPAFSDVLLASMFVPLGHDRWEGKPPTPDPQGCMEELCKSDIVLDTTIKINFTPAASTMSRGLSLMDARRPTTTRAAGRNERKRETPPSMDLSSASNG